MVRESYQNKLDELRGAVVDLGNDVLRQLDHGLTAFEDADGDLGKSVIDGDEAINERYLDLEADCIDLFALQQPVASDLRFVASSFKILTDLERVGDLASNFAGYALVEGHEDELSVDVSHIGRDAMDMVEEALIAYEIEDLELCYEVAERDDEIDTLCQHASEQIVRDLIEREHGADDTWAVERLLDDVSRLLLTIRDIERVGDHAVNIAARTLYMIEQDSDLIY